MDKILNLQISLFGSFVNIQPQIAIVNHLVESLKEKEMIPGIATVNTILAETQEITTENRLKMESTDHAWQIVFLQDRIDVNYIFPGGEKIYTELNNVVEEAKEIASLVFSCFPETTGNRIAINGKVLLKQMNEDVFHTFIRRFSTPLKCFADRPISEMNIHYNSPFEVLINHNVEICNYIIDIFEIVGIDSVSKEIQKRNAIGIDINTDKDNKDMKYKIKDVLEFVDCAIPYMTYAIQEIAGETL